MIVFLLILILIAILFPGALRLLIGVVFVGLVLAFVMGPPAHSATLDDRPFDCVEAYRVLASDLVNRAGVAVLVNRYGDASHEANLIADYREDVAFYRATASDYLANCHDPVSVSVVQTMIAGTESMVANYDAQMRAPPLTAKQQADRLAKFFGAAPKPGPSPPVDAYAPSPPVDAYLPTSPSWLLKGY